MNKFKINKNEKIIIIMSGLPASGKSTWIKEKNFDPDDIVSMDTIREYCGAIKYSTENNALEISQELNSQVFNLYKTILECRFQLGRFTIIDNTNLSGHYPLIKELCTKYGYKCFVKRIECPFDEILIRNTQRGYKNVPKEVLIKMNTYKFIPENWYEII